MELLCLPEEGVLDCRVFREKTCLIFFFSLAMERETETGKGEEEGGGKEGTVGVVGERRKNRRSIQLCKTAVVKLPYRYDHIWTSGINFAGP